MRILAVALLVLLPSLRTARAETDPTSAPLAALVSGGVSPITSASSICPLPSPDTFADASEVFAFGSAALSFFVDFGASAIVHLSNLYTRP